MRQSSDSADRNGQNGWIRNNWRPISILVAILFIALFLRVAFAFNISAGSGFALSGGSDAQYHLRIVEALLNGQFILNDPMLNHPIGGFNYSPPLFDALSAGLAGILKLFGFTTIAASSAALATITAILGALTCIPVFFIGREIFNQKVGIVAGLVYAITSVAIVNTVFSNGTAISLYVLLFAIMSYFILKLVKSFKFGEEGATLSVAFLANKTSIKYAIIVGILLGMIELSWLGFPFVIILLSIIMVVHAVYDRLNGRNSASLVMMYAIIIAIGTIIGAAYYIPVGLASVAIGPAILAVIAIVLSFFISTFRLWVISLPVSLIITVVAFALLAVFLPDIFASMLSSGAYADAKFASLFGAASPSISMMAVYFGWISTWFSLVVIGYLVYKLFTEHKDAPIHIMTIAWFTVLMVMCWFSLELAMLASTMFAVGIAAFLVWLVEKAGIPEYIDSFKGCTFKTFWKKLFAPFPFVVVVLVAVLVVTPNVMMAVDASIPSNDKSDYKSQFGYVGAYNYYVNDKSQSWNNVWDSNLPRDGALVTWFQYGSEAVVQGGFPVVADGFGKGYSSASNILLSDGSASAVAAMIARILSSDKGLWHETTLFLNKYTNEQRDVLFNILYNWGSCLSIVKGDPGTFSDIGQGVTAENAMYMLVSKYLTSEYSVNGVKGFNMNDSHISDLYDKVCADSGDKIKYIAVDGSMFPLYYGDSNFFSVLAYLNDYILDSKGSPSKYYQAVGQGYPYYFKQAMYETLLWKAYIGAPLGDGWDTGWIDKFSLSTGEYKAQPGFGLSNFAVAYWHVMYNPDSKATLASSGWEEMDAREAISLQEKEGGLINYLSGLPVLLEYIETNEITGKISVGSQNAKGIRVSVVDKTTGIQMASAFTDENGNYTLAVPADGRAYELRVYTGSTKTTDGTLATVIPSGQTQGQVTEIQASSITGDLSVVVDKGDVVIDYDTSVKMVGKASGKTYEFNVANGKIDYKGMIPDKYDVTIKRDGATIYTGTYEAIPGPNDGMKISLSDCSITVTVNNREGQSIYNVPIILTETTTGAKITGYTTGVDGKVKIPVVPGTYVINVDSDKYVNKDLDGLSLTAQSRVTATVSADKTTTDSKSIIAVAAKEIKINGAPDSHVMISNGTYTTSVYTGGTTSVYVPVDDYFSTDGYYGYALDNKGTKAGMIKVINDEASFSMTDARTVSGDIKMAGTVNFILNGAVFTTTTKDGKYSAILPTGTYTMYAYASGSTKAAIASVEVSNADVTKDLELGGANKITGTIKGSSRDLANIPLTFTRVGGDVPFSITVSTSWSGTYTVVLPKGADYKITSSILDQTVTDSNYATKTKYFSGKVDTNWPEIKNLNSDLSRSITLSTRADVKVPVILPDGFAVKKSGTDIWLDPTGGLESGTYTVAIDGSNGQEYANGKYYSSTSMTVSPGQFRTYTPEAKSVSKITVTGTDPTDVLSISGGTGKTFLSTTSGERAYYVETNTGTYTVKVVSSDGKKVGYQDVSSSSSSTTNVTKYDAITVTGYVGLPTSGKIDVTVRIGSDVGTVSGTIANGQYTVTLPYSESGSPSYTFKVNDVSLTVNGVKYKFELNKSFTFTPKDGKATVNMEVQQTGTPDYPKFQVDKVIRTGDGFKVTLRNTTSSSQTVMLKSGSGWESFTQTYGAIPANGTIDFTVKAAPVPGVDNKVSVLDINGKEITSFLVPSGKELPEIESVNRISKYEYAYGLRMSNTTSDPIKYVVSFDKSKLSALQGSWYMTFVDENGMVLPSTDNSCEFTVPGGMTKTVYLRLISMNGEKMNEDIKFNMFVNSSKVFEKSTGIVIDAKVTDTDASGNNIFNLNSTIPVGVWILLVVFIMSALLAVWLGLRRGVFSRRK